MVEKRGCGRPRGSKNMPKTSATTSSSTTLSKRRRGCPLGSKNKKLSGATASAADHLDVSLAQPSLPHSFADNFFSFFAFSSAQCHEQ
jgi:PAB1-binding protein PBP1